jgi:hypothetical protein
MFADEAPTYLIDLEKPAAQRWAEVISRETTVTSRLVAEAGTEFERVPELLRWVFASLYHAAGGLYRDEIASWADALGVSLGTITIFTGPQRLLTGFGS